MKMIKNLLAKLRKTEVGPRDCRTRMINERFFECKVRKPNPNYCEFSLSSGSGFICNHQDREIFTRK